MLSTELNIRDTYNNEELFLERVKQLINMLLLPKNSNILINSNHASEYLYFFRDDYENSFCEIIIYSDKLDKLHVICNGGSLLKYQLLEDLKRHLTERYKYTCNIINETTRLYKLHKLEVILE